MQNFVNKIVRLTIVLLTIVSLTTQTYAQTAPTGQRYLVTPDPGMLPGTETQYANVNLTESVSHSFGGWPMFVEPQKLVIGGTNRTVFFDVWANDPTFNHTYVKMMKRTFSYGGQLPMRHNTCQYQELKSYTDVISCYTPTDVSAKTIPYDIAKNYMTAHNQVSTSGSSVNVSGHITTAITVTFGTVFITSGKLKVRTYYNYKYSNNYPGGCNPTNNPECRPAPGDGTIQSPSTVQNFSILIDIGSVSLTSNPVPADPNTDPNRLCKLQSGAYPHGTMPFVPDDLGHLPVDFQPDGTSTGLPPGAYGEVFKFANGYGPGTDLDCLFVIGPKPGANYLLGTDFCSPGEPCQPMSNLERVIFYNGTNYGPDLTPIHGVDGCYEQRNFIRDITYKIQGGDHWNTKTCLYYALPLPPQPNTNVTVLGEEVVNVTLVPETPEDAMETLIPGEEILPETMTPAEQVLAEIGTLPIPDGAPSGSGSLSMSELTNLTSGAVTVKKEPTPCTIQDYYHPLNYYADGSCLGSFDDAWGKVAFDPTMAAVWGATPSSADATLDQLSVLNWPIFNGPICSIAIANFDNCWRIVKPRTVMGTPGAPPVKLPPNSIVPPEEGLEGGGGTGSDPTPPENPEDPNDPGLPGVDPDDPIDIPGLPGSITAPGEVSISGYRGVEEGFYYVQGTLTEGKGFLEVFEEFQTDIGTTVFMESINSFKLEGDPQTSGDMLLGTLDFRVAGLGQYPLTIPEWLLTLMGSIVMVAGTWTAFRTIV